MIRKIIYIIVLCITSLACYDDELIFDNEVLIVEIDSNNQYYADGVSEVEVKVYLDTTLNIPLEPKYQIVLLSSEGGTFKNPSIKLIPNSAAKITFVPNTIPGTFEIKASIENKNSVSASTPITLNRVFKGDVINLQLVNDTVFANGYGLIKGYIQINRTNTNSLNLSTSENNAIFISTNQNKISKNMQIGLADTFHIKTSTKPGIYLVTAALDNENKTTINTAYVVQPLNSADIIQLKLDSTITWIADGSTIIKGTVIINNYKPEKIRLSSVNGNFVTNNEASIVIEPDNSGTGTFLYRLGTQYENHILDISLENTTFNIKTVVNVEPSLPDTLLIETSSYEIDSINGSATFTISLLKNSGQVSDGQIIDIKAYQTLEDNNIAVGRFTGFPLKSDNNGQVVSTFHLDTRFAHKSTPIIIKVSSEGNNNKTIESNLELLVR